jgi:hypothetical protein
MMMVFWGVAPCTLVEIDRLFISAYCFHHQGALVMEAVRTSEMSKSFYQITRRNIPEDSHIQDYSPLSSSPLCSFQISCYSIFLKSKYSPRHFVLENSQPLNSLSPCSKRSLFVMFPTQNCECVPCLWHPSYTVCLNYGNPLI